MVVLFEGDSGRSRCLTKFVNFSEVIGLVRGGRLWERLDTFCQPSMLCNKGRDFSARLSILRRLFQITS